ncbi:MAG: hypothetical protein LBU90_03720 [Bacteroidales bacterium]|jgi:hypothetical protein|nr:hypothetical protein [Bacteroidales bacterium]
MASLKQKAAQNRAKRLMKLAQDIQNKAGYKTIPAKKVHKVQMSICLKKASQVMKQS